jgi:hypothetical protein
MLSPFTSKTIDIGQYLSMKITKAQLHLGPEGKLCLADYLSTGDWGSGKVRDGAHRSGVGTVVYVCFV